jgi:hypothetical protein
VIDGESWSRGESWSCGESWSRGESWSWGESGSRGDEYRVEDDESLVGGDGHSAGGSSEAWVKHRRISANFGLSPGSDLTHNSAISQMG